MNPTPPLPPLTLLILRAKAKPMAHPHRPTLHPNHLKVITMNPHRPIPHLNNINQVAQPLSINTNNRLLEAAALDYWEQPW